MKSLFKIFLDSLEKFSGYLEKASRPMERRFAYFFCTMQIVVCVIAGAIAFGFFVVEFQKQTSWDVRFVLIGFILFVLFMLGSWIHMIFTRDLRHIRNTDPNKKEDPMKKRKIEF